MSVSKKKDPSSILTAFDLWKLAKKQRLICALTGRKLYGGNVSPDHIIPHCKGGTSDISNLRLVVKEANLAKQILLDEEFISLCNDVIKHKHRNA